MLYALTDCDPIKGLFFVFLAADSKNAVDIMTTKDNNDDKGLSDKINLENLWLAIRPGQNFKSVWKICRILNDMH